jgi:uncharacterized protein YjbJ (UPF0337 family)
MAAAHPVAPTHRLMADRLPAHSVWHADCTDPDWRQNMADSTKDKIEGKFHEVKGAVKEKIGQAANDPNLEDEGTGEKIAGKVQKKVGDIEKVFEK